MNELPLVPTEYDIAWFVCDVPNPVLVESHWRGLVNEYWVPPSYEAAMYSLACVNYISVYQVHNDVSTVSPDGKTEQNCESAY